MAASSRYALLVALTNHPGPQDWETIDRIFKLLTPSLTTHAKTRIANLIKKRELYIIPTIIEILSLDNEEYLHLTNSIYKNGVEHYRKRNQNHEKIHEAKGHKKLE